MQNSRAEEWGKNRDKKIEEEVLRKSGISPEA